MNERNSAESNDQRPASSRRPLKIGGKTIGGIAAVALIAVYSFVQPILQDRFGVNLPSLRQNSQGQVVTDAAPAAGAKKKTPTKQDNTKAASASSSKQTTKPTDASKTTSPKSPSITKPDKTKSNDLLYGLLREVGPQQYLSPAGLQYKPGSVEGHRLEHLRRHTADNPSRPGSHGVFDGEMAGALKTIDQAYEKAKRGTRTTKKIDGGRTIYTVDMGRRVGYVGGRDGQQKRNPMARRVRLVLEGTSVITAYPMN